jgi:hypothetical protein
MRVDFKMGGEFHKLNFTITPTKGSGFSAIASSSKDLDILQKAISSATKGDSTVPNMLRHSFERKLGVPVEIDYDYNGAGFGFKIDMYSLVKKIK